MYVNTSKQIRRLLETLYRVIAKVHDLLGQQLYFFLQTQKANDLLTINVVLGPIIICSNDDLDLLLGIVKSAYDAYTRNRCQVGVYKRWSFGLKF